MMVTASQLVSWYNALRKKRGIIPLKSSSHIQSDLRAYECPCLVTKHGKQKRYLFNEEMAKCYLRIRLNDRKFEPNYKCHVFGAVDELSTGWLTVNAAADKYGVKLPVLQNAVTLYNLRSKVHPVTRRNMVKETDMLEWLKNYRPRKHKLKHERTTL